MRPGEIANRTLATLKNQRLIDHFSSIFYVFVFHF